MINALDLSPVQWKEALQNLGEPSYRAGQVFSALHAGKDFSQMLTLPLPLREKLSETYTARGVTIRGKFISAHDGTVKYLYLLADGQLIEGVRMRYYYGDTLCVSTQAGCRMNCAFCASALSGLSRNLSPGEMIGQIITANLDEPKIGNIVLMGSGEPLDNYDAVLSFLRLLREPGGLSLSMRSVSLSTCGIVPKIIQFAGEGLPVTLSVSLHGPNDDIRKRLMPVAAVYGIETLLDACRFYIQKTGRRVIFEYALIRGVNCEPGHAEELSRRLRGMICHVNLIALNPVPEKALEAASPKEIATFQHVLETRHISVTRRREMGRDISGACGQLRRRALEEGGGNEGDGGNGGTLLSFQEKRK